MWNSTWFPTQSTAWLLFILHCCLLWTFSDALAHSLDLLILCLLHLKLLLDPIVNLLVFIDEILYSFNFFKYYSLFFFILWYHGCKLLLNLISFFIGGICCFNNLADIFSLLSKLFLKSCIYLVEYDFLFPQIVYLSSHCFILSNQFIESLISFIKSTLQNLYLFGVLRLINSA